jgi:hypothetical protein
MAGQATAKRLEAVSSDKDKAPEEVAAKEPDKLEAATSEVLDSKDVRIVSWRDLELVVPKDEQVTAITDLSEQIMSSYGTTPGESEASEDS